MNIRQDNDLFKLIINLLIISAFLYVIYAIVSPFLFGFFWALMLTITTWPIMLKLQKKVFNSRMISTVIMTSILSLFFIIPFSLVITSIAKNGSYLIDLTKNFNHESLPELLWLKTIPFIGEEIYAKWDFLVKNESNELFKMIQPYIGVTVSWLLSQLTNISVIMFHCGVMIIFSFLFFLKGEQLSDLVHLFAKTLSKNHGESTIDLAGKSIRAVALGVVLTAVIQAFISAITLMLTQVPFTGLLTLIIFICCVVQIGPSLIMGGAAIWQFVNGDIFYGVILVIITIILTTSDTFMRSYLIKKGVDLPFWLVIFGVIGGILAFGMMGLFIGPVILALSYNFIQAWMKESS